MATIKKQKPGRGSGSGSNERGERGGERVVARPKLRSSHEGGLKAPEGSRARGPAARLPRPSRTGAPAGSRAPAPRARDGNPRVAPRPSRAAPGSSAPARPGPRTRKAKGQPGGGAGGTASDSARELAIAIAIAALDKKAVGLEILDVAGKVDYADFLVIMTGRSDRQVQALAAGIEDALRQKNARPLAVEGLPHASWVLMDYGDVVVHVFQDDARSLYDIEGLWMDARRIPVPVPEEVR